MISASPLARVYLYAGEPKNPKIIKKAACSLTQVTAEDSGEKGPPKGLSFGHPAWPSISEEREVTRGRKDIQD